VVTATAEGDNRDPMLDRESVPKIEGTDVELGDEREMGVVGMVATEEELDSCLSGGAPASLAPAAGVDEAGSAAGAAVGSGVGSGVVSVVVSVVGSGVGGGVSTVLV